MEFLMEISLKNACFLSFILRVIFAYIECQIKYSFNPLETVYKVMPILPLNVQKGR